MKFQQCDVLVIGAGNIGLATGITILENNLRLRVVIAEKEEGLAKHAYGRNTWSQHRSKLCEFLLFTRSFQGEVLSG